MAHSWCSVVLGQWRGGRGVSEREHNEELLALPVAVRVSAIVFASCLPALLLALTASLDLHLWYSAVSLPLGTGVWAVWNKEDGLKADPDRMQESIDLRPRCVFAAVRVEAGLWPFHGVHTNRISRQGGGGFAESRYMELVRRRVGAAQR
ncbi:hypothetical protein K438DRAFT_1778046 [Mycena galopus ATCC 62051]|nr:hypothetical protein K438DRAFT_1778046 [Mycena galopus ATCC 62051]